MSEKNPYAPRAHRQKYKLGYGVEGLSKNSKPLMPEESTDKNSSTEKPKSKTKPNPY